MFTLQRDKAGLLLIDVQEKLFPLIQHRTEALAMMEKVIQGCRLLQLPIAVTEQYPKGLGPTLPDLRKTLGEAQEFWSKCCFSCMGDNELRGKLLSLPVQQWMIIGMEAHVCVFLTARDLIQAKREVVIVADAISSRSDFNYSTAIEEMRSIGARISCSETVMFELMRDSKDPRFKSMSQLFR